MLLSVKVWDIMYCRQVASVEMLRGTQLRFDAFGRSRKHGHHKSVQRLCQNDKPAESLCLGSPAASKVPSSRIRIA